MIGCPCEVCASADPKDNRLRSSILVQSPSTSVVVDATPDFRAQMLKHQITHIDALLITHPHKDHVAGIDDTRPFQFFTGKATKVYGNNQSLNGIKKEIPYAFEEVRYPGVPAIELHEISLEPFLIGDIPVTPIEVWHHKMKVYGFRFGKFTYITDANKISAEERKKILGSEYIVLNALRHQSHISHFSLSEAINVVNDLAVPNAWFTHISHQLGLHKEVSPGLPEGIGLAYDGLTISL